MNSIHDMGGMDGFGPIEREENEANFHHPWEKRVFGLFFCLFAGGLLNVDRLRHAIERMGNQQYLDSSYYEHWLRAYEILLDEDGIVTRAELEQRIAQLAREVN